MQKVIFELKSKLGVKLTDRNFDMVHRLGQFSKTANRPVICKVKIIIKIAIEPRSRKACLC